MANYEAAMYRGGEGKGQSRWAVYCKQSRTYVFPAMPGKAAAITKAAALNRLDKESGQ